MDVDSIVAELLADQPPAKAEFDLAIRGGARYVPRLMLMPILAGGCVKMMMSSRSCFCSISHKPSPTPTPPLPTLSRPSA